MEDGRWKMEDGRGKREEALVECPFNDLRVAPLFIVIIPSSAFEIHCPTVLQDSQRGAEQKLQPLGNSGVAG